MLIAKYFNKPLIGIAPIGGKFRKKEKEIYGTVYSDYTDPFVAVTCDKIVKDIVELSECIVDVKTKKRYSDISLLDQAINYYQNNYYTDDEFVKSLGL